MAKNRIGKRFAIKLYRPTGHAPLILKDCVKQFIREVKILASLSHKNIVKVYTAGTARWNEEQKKWNLSEGIDIRQLESDEFLYLIMDFIEGKDISSLFPELRKKDGDQSEYTEIPAYERLRLFEEMVFQVSNGISYYHSKNYTHKDIKPDNIRYSTDDATFIIVDFGFARHKDSPQDIETIIRTEYMDLESIWEQNYESNDLGQFCRVLLKVLPSLKDEYDPARYQGIMSVLEKGKHTSLQLRYRTVSDFYESLAPYFVTLPQWKFELRLNEYLCPNRFGRFSRKLRIPVSGSILLTDEIKAIVDTAEFQRLRGIRQLGPTIFVYPGANHTRYEHSLGTCYLSLKYIEKLYNLPAFRDLCQPIDVSIKLIVLSSLLHDIGHYPYSHWIEEIEKFSKGGLKFPKHEDRARTIICEGAIRDLIEDRWGVSSEVIANIIANRHTAERDILINSFLNSIIDVDKVDYLIRDSIHCGVNYGKGIDVERLLDSLYVNPSNKKICLTDKGKSCLLSIITCRNIMYQEVYWHKTVRACDAMFKRFIYEYIKAGVDDVSTVQEYFNHPDDFFIAELFNRAKAAKKEKLAKLAHPFALGGRSLYKPAYIFSRSTAELEPTDTRNFFNSILGLTSYSALVKKGNLLATHLKRRIPRIGPLDIIIEKTPVKWEHEIYDLQGFQIWNLRRERFEDYHEELKDSNRYLGASVQVYIFCSPDYYGDLNRLAMKGQLDNILGEVEDAAQ